jgi:hypothetical protein
MTANEAAEAYAQALRENATALIDVTPSSRQHG